MKFIRRRVTFGLHNYQNISSSVVESCSDGSNGGCEHICSEKDGEVECDCEMGYELSTNAKSCMLISLPIMLTQDGMLKKSW